MATQQDYYQVLGVPKTASDSDIKAAYRKQALQWHPDRNKDPKATEKFKEVTHAYEVLSDPQKRQAYDQFGPAAFEPGAAGDQGPFGGFGETYHQNPFTYTYRTYGTGESPFEGFAGFSDPFEIFEQFFGGAFSTPRSRTRRPIYSLAISFLESAKGTEKTVSINGKNMTIKIPAGVNDQSRVRFSDFDVVLSVTPDKTFKRDGADVYVDAEIDFAQAALGDTIEVPTIDDPVTIKVPSGTQPETLIRLRGRGIKSPQGGSPGDQYVRIRVKVPTKLSRKQKELLEELHGDSPPPHSGWF